MGIHRGALIVFEGCDRCGKSTQARRIVERLLSTNRKAEFMCFPDRSTDLGKFIDRYLKNEVELNAREAHLVFAANRQGVVEKMREKLLSGTTLIVDRYLYSGIAYSMAKGTLNQSMEWAKLHDVGELKPDRILFFDIHPSEVKTRSGFGDERLESLDLQTRVYEYMKMLMSEDEELWKTIEAKKNIDDVTEDVWNAVTSVLSSVSNKPLSYVDINPSVCQKC
ncbi:hypothetical protein AB6A40_003431 [Gnathostoma spinigerum]|uniref:Thymidylate kinase n=1 Tax=Gnathostoma spinigerum TaxID=75299 RepID=A0ABD6EBT2_9BILA